ncbi:hypothetical protein IU500_18500 [Nocardia terpenica]|uniref:Uncharacterized protein n=1 Tax=Nocardia terpenica TaxID=455432 RepID=A0A164JHL2_9NOCA|nr:hypothetical protein [Nocardia terpenica]KZM70411.1 hypothetical protein AWN90_03775 [Nocardia terpenica]MBF6063477.1 hypothetical protein [Nocardia terpenica]MBF6106033.1 hypothetical protein [Nocardia terpenica]MBF6113382.1 hypothetical protein [Nocardia terpenica]MBF6119774.1 hypothetical protein [Nocardia terpenica]
MIHLLDTVVLAQEIKITPEVPPGAGGLTKIVNWVAWAVTLAGIAALIYAGGKFGWERWHGGAVESPKIVLGALAGGIIATSAGTIMQQIVSAK